LIAIGERGFVQLPRLAVGVAVVALSLVAGSRGSTALQAGHQHGTTPPSKDGHDHDHGNSKQGGHEGMAGHTHGEIPAEYRDARLAGAAWTDSNVLARGKAIYETRCAVCHGESGDGKGPAAASLPLKPPDLRDARMVNEMTPSYWFWRVSEGGFVEPFRSQGSIMPAWKDVLSVDERWAVIAYQHTFSGHQGSHDHAPTQAGHAGMPGHAGMRRPMEGGHQSMTAHVHAEVPSDYRGSHIPAAAWTHPDLLARGKVIYAARCAVCHGDSGDGKGPGAASLPLKPPDLRDASMVAEMPGNYWFWRVSEGASVEPFRSQGSTMPAWKDVLSVEERWAVIAYAHTLSGHNAPHVTSEHPEMIAAKKEGHGGMQMPAQGSGSVAPTGTTGHRH
jgi:mono/diheme cytochrome c family protein